jgi:hypothetical protein
VVHVCLNIEDALNELPGASAGAFSGAAAGACNVGSNQDRAGADRIAPRAIVFGAGPDDGPLPNRNVGAVMRAVNVKALRVVKLQLPEAIFEAQDVAATVVADAVVYKMTDLVRDHPDALKVVTKKDVYVPEAPCY